MVDGLLRFLLLSHRRIIDVPFARGHAANLNLGDTGTDKVDR